MKNACLTKILAHATHDKGKKGENVATHVVVSGYHIILF